jgi:hypothetical protein
MTLHLAQVKKNPTTGDLYLQFLAYQKTENLWEFSDLQPLTTEKTTGFHEGMLVLAEVDDKGEIIICKDAKEWVLNLLQTYLMEESINHEFLEVERVKLEKWRQEITSQTQDLNRLRLEIEARREELQSPKRERTTHDYRRLVAGQDYIFEPIEGEDRAYLTGRGERIKAGDYLILFDRYQIEKIDYYASPPDMWWIALIKRTNI